MAHVLSEFPRQPNKTSLNYVQYLDGRVYRLKQGVDFVSKSLKSLRTTFYNMASARGCRVRIHEESRAPLVVIVQAYKKEPVSQKAEGA